MIEIVKKRVYLLLIACGALAGMTSCDDEDPTAADFDIPVVKVAPISLSGIIAAKDGSSLPGARVSLGSLVTTTDDDGFYVFYNVKPGSYVIKAEAAGKLVTEDNINVVDNSSSRNLVWNTLMVSADAQQVVAASSTVDKKVEMKTEVLENNDEAEVNVEATIPASAVEASDRAAKENVAIVMNPIYTDGTDTRSTDLELLVGTKLSCSDPNAKLVKEIDLVYELDPSVVEVAKACKCVNGKWVPAKCIKGCNRVTIKCDVWAEYALVCEMATDTERGDVIPLDFVRNEWDNVRGSKDMFVGKADYIYRTGLDVLDRPTTKLEALMVERMYTKYGVSATVLRGSYPLNFFLPVGCKLTVDGYQKINKITSRVCTTSVHAIQYDDVKIFCKICRRHHLGGCN